MPCQARERALYAGEPFLSWAGNENREENGGGERDQQCLRERKRKAEE